MHLSDIEMYAKTVGDKLNRVAHALYDLNELVPVVDWGLRRATSPDDDARPPLQIGDIVDRITWAYKTFHGGSLYQEADCSKGRPLIDRADVLQVVSFAKTIINAYDFSSVCPSSHSGRKKK